VPQRQYGLRQINIAEMKLAWDYGRTDMTSSEVAVANLLGRYAEAIDAGQLEQAAKLFTHARVKIGDGSELDSAALLALWRSLIIIYPDGTPRTKHVITNLIVDLEETKGTATVRSYYTVFQKTEDSPLQVVCAGRYLDEFERVDDAWRWAYRDYSLCDLRGDLSRHLRQTPTGLGRSVSHEYQRRSVSLRGLTTPQE